MSISLRPNVRLFGLPGSLRQNSYCVAVLKALQGALAPNVALDIFEPALPLYSEDADGDATPDEVRRFRASVLACDGAVIVTPEYNHSISGVLKNALDWASRPLGAAALTGKPVAVISVSPAFTGGVRAQAHLHDILLAIRCRIVGGPQIVIGNIHEKVSNGIFVDEASIAFALAAINKLVGELRPSCVPKALAQPARILEGGSV
jgi:chromate reductase